MADSKPAGRTMTRSGRGGEARDRQAAAPRLSRRAVLPTLAVVPAAAATLALGNAVPAASLLGVETAVAQETARAAKRNRVARADRWRLIPGATVQVTGSGFTPGGKGRLLWQANSAAQRSLGRLRADQRGRVAATVRIPDTAAGSQKIALRIGKRAANVKVTVEKPGGNPLAFGVFEKSGGNEAPWHDAPLVQLQRAIGRDPEIVMWYQGWGANGDGKNLDLSMLDRVSVRGAIPMITWEPWVPNGRVDQPQYKLSVIAGSTYDTYVRSWASQLAAWGKPVLLRFAHEMNGTWYPWAAGKNGNSAADYVEAWQHLRSVFDEENANNVGWVWSPNVHVDGFTDMADLYPGDEYVDWIGLDGYNWGNWNGHRWQSFSGVFGPSIAKVRSFAAGKPLMIAETASGSDGGDKAAWIRSAFFSEIPIDFPEIRAVVWFDENKEKVGERPWRYDTDTGSAKAFRAAANHPHYRAALSSGDVVTASGARKASRDDGGTDRTRERGRDRPRKRRKRRNKR